MVRWDGDGNDGDGDSDGDGDGDGDGDDDEEEAMLKRELHLGRFQGDNWIAVLNDEYLKVETLGWSAQRKGSWSQGSSHPRQQFPPGWKRSLILYWKKFPGEPGTW